MDRRTFITTTGVGAATAAVAGVLTHAPLGSTVAEAQGQRSTATPRKLLMKLGSNANPYDPADLMRVKRFGVTSIVGDAEQSDPERRYPTVEEFKKMRELPDKMGLEMAVHSAPKPGVRNTLLGKDPERQREIEDFQLMIKNAAAAGIPCVKYNMAILGNVRTGTDPGRADTSYRSSNLKLVQQESDRLGLTEAGVVKADLYWERLTYFLERVVPVANEYKVRIACHPNDSIVPATGYRGVVPVLSTPEGLKRYVTIQGVPITASISASACSAR